MEEKKEKCSYVAWLWDLDHNTWDAYCRIPFFIYEVGTCV